MELETIRDRGFYGAKAHEHPQLSKVIAGESTLGQLLENTLSAMDLSTASFKDTLKFIFSKSEVQNGFPEYLGMLLDLSSDSLEKKVIAEGNAAVEKFLSWNGGKAYKVALMGSSGGLGTGAVGLILLFTGLIPLAVGGIVTAGITALASYSASGTSLYGKSVEDKCKEVLAPVYELAEQIDCDIMASFALDYFNNGREHFEQIYLKLSDEQRKRAETQIYAFL